MAAERGASVMSGQITVEVAYAEPTRQLIVSLRAAPGTTAMQAVRQSGIRDEFPALGGEAELELGIFAKQCAHDTVLRPGDRVEIYRPLTIDPKEARRLKAEAARRRQQATAEAATKAGA